MSELRVAPSDTERKLRMMSAAQDMAFVLLNCLDFIEASASQGQASDELYLEVVKVLTAAGVPV